MPQPNVQMSRWQWALTIGLATFLIGTITTLTHVDSSPPEEEPPQAHRRLLYGSTTPEQRCANVTDENWHRASWGDQWHSKDRCITAITEPETVACTIASLPYFCYAWEDGSVMVMSMGTIHKFTPEEARAAGDALVIIEPDLARTN